MIPYRRACIVSFCVYKDLCIPFQQLLYDQVEQRKSAYDSSIHAR